MGYRPSYPRDLLDKLTVVAELRPSHVVADLGSGTGIFTRLLLDSGARVLGVEPNAAMRSAAERGFRGEPRFESRDARAEATGLPDASIDLITAAQAFRWFDPSATRAECARILRPGGRVARDRAAEPRIRAFFAPAAASLVTFHNEQRLDKAGLCGRLRSSSYAPTRDSPMYEPMMSEASSIFDTHARQGCVVMEYETLLWYGSLSS